MNKLKLTMFLRWAGAVLDEWAQKANPRRTAGNALHKDIRNAAGRELRMLIVPLGNDPGSKLHQFLISRSISSTFGSIANIVWATDAFRWDDRATLDAIVANYERAHQLLKDNNCDVLIVRKASESGLLLQLVGVTTEAPWRFALLDKFGLPVPFSRKTSRIFAARLFVTCTQVVPMGSLRFPPLQQLIAELPDGEIAPNLGGWAAANIGFLNLLLAEQTASTDYFKKATDYYRHAMAGVSREKDPLAWARMQHDFGTVLRTLGEREKEITLLEQAVEAFRAALSERRRDSVPMQWAATQANFGAALTSLGLPNGNWVTDAVAAFEAASAIWTREHAPIDWAELQNHQGRVFSRAADQNKDPALLEHAIEAFRAGIAVMDEQQLPERRAALQQNLGNVLLRLANHRNTTTELEQAVAALRAAQTVQSRHTSPEQWSAAQHRIALALVKIGIRTKEKGYLQQAIVAYRDALKVRTRRRMPELWAATQSDLAAALLKLADFENDPAHLKDAISALENALMENTREQMPMQWAGLQNSLGAALTQLADHEEMHASLERAVIACRAALEVYEVQGTTQLAKVAKRNLAAAERRLKGVSAV